MKTVLLLVLLPMLVACSAPSFELSDGSKRTVESYEGQWLLINYWAEWCRPCLEEIPELNEINHDSGVQVLGVDYDQSVGTALEDKVKRLGIEYPSVVRDPSGLFSQQPPSGLPATMVIDDRGRFIKWLMGPQTKETLRAEIL